VHKRILWVGVIVVALSLSACSGAAHTPLALHPRPPIPGGLVPGQLVSGGMTRSYLLYAPPGLEHDRPVPLVLVLSGGGDTDSDMVQITQFDPVAQSEKFLVAYPEGFEESWDAGFCCAGAFTHHVDDVAFLQALISLIEASYPVSAAQVYLVGASNGAIMAYYFACHEAALVAGVGSVAGAMPIDSCHPSRPVPVLEIHGTADPSLPYLGGKVEPPGADATRAAPATMAVMRRWATLDGCDPLPKVRHAPPVTTYTWSPCRQGTLVQLVAVSGASHVWFAPGFGPLDGAVDATGLIWHFFSSLPRTGSAG
jgi:polyhydroxybutyrate depolymerase